jgi:hypothetical protein
VKQRRRGRGAGRGAFDGGDGVDGVDPGERDDLGVDSSEPADRPGLSMDVVDEITWYMREHKVSRAQLAGAMGVSTGRVCRLLSGGESLTPRTLGVVLAALGARIEITLHPAGEPATAHAHASA